MFYEAWTEALLNFDILLKLWIMIYDRMTKVDTGGCTMASTASQRLWATTQSHCSQTWQKRQTSSRLVASCSQKGHFQLLHWAVASFLVARDVRHRLLTCASLNGMEGAAPSWRTCLLLYPTINVILSLLLLIPGASMAGQEVVCNTKLYFERGGVIMFPLSLSSQTHTGLIRHYVLPYYAH